MKKILIPLACLPLLSACIIRIDTHDNYLEKEETLELSTDGLSNLVANTGAGSLMIVGERGRATVEVQASINYHEEEDIELSLEQRGDSAVLDAGSRYNFYNDHPPVINLLVRVPESFDLKLDDSSGHIEIADVLGNMQITDGSGHIEIRGGHNIDINDDSGHINVSGASGNVDIKDGSGHIDVSEVKGDVRVDDDSGNMLLRFVDGEVEIYDGSGNIEVDEIGALNIVESGSGKLRVHKVRGKIIVQD